MVKNESGLRPLGRAVLVRHIERKEGLIVIPENVDDRVKMIETKVEVIEIGPAAWPNEEARAKKGDIVMISRMAGWFAGKARDGLTYRIVNDNDIFAGVEDEHV